MAINPKLKEAKTALKEAQKEQASVIKQINKLGTAGDKARAKVDKAQAKVNKLS